MVDLDKIFGPKSDLLAWKNRKPAVLIRHGIFSSNKPFEGLQGKIDRFFGSPLTYNDSYDWKKSVLRNGFELANEVFVQPKYHDRPIIFIGHSMGGLIIRVANALLTDVGFRKDLHLLAKPLGYSHEDIEIWKKTELRKSETKHEQIVGIVTLATPNSGAVLHGQVSGIGALVHGAVQLFAPAGCESIADLTTARIFLLLEYAKSSTPMLSISGSRFNRLARGSGQLASWGTKFGIKMEYPHDGIVEDRSVDLAHSVIANEVTHLGTAPYLHMRAYRTCTLVSHIEIYDNPEIQDSVFDFMQRV